MMPRVDRGVCPLCLATLLLFLAPGLAHAGQLQLVEAVKQSDETAIRALLELEIDVNAPEGDGATALHWAVYRDKADTVELLIGAGANVNAANDLGITPLALAAVNGNAVIAETLLRSGADPAVASEVGVTPLMGGRAHREHRRSAGADGVRSRRGRERACSGADGAHVGGVAATRRCGRGGCSDTVPTSMPGRAHAHG